MSGFGKSREEKKLPNGDDILSCISDQDVFKFYLGGLPSKKINSPLRDDTNPSFSLFRSKKYNKILYKDFATGEVGDCFVFVMRLFNLNKKTDAFNRVAKDFNLDQFHLSGGSTPAVWKRPKIKIKANSLKNKRVQIRVTVRNWKNIDKNYWYSKYGFTKKELEYCNIYPISHYFINGQCVVAEDLAYTFIEEKDGLQTFKIYQPFSEKSKWINNNDYSTWELWTQLPKNGKNLIITSSRKDAIVIKKMFDSCFITSCSLQSENVNPKENVINELKSRFENIFVLYDNDFKNKINNGKIAGEKLANKFNLLDLQIPNIYEIKDPSDFLEEYGLEKTKEMILFITKDRLLEKKIRDSIN